MSDLTNKTIKCDNNFYYIYSELKYNTEMYLLALNIKIDNINESVKIFKLISKDNEYYIDDKIDKEVISKFIVFLSL